MILLPPALNFTALLHDFVKLSIPFVTVYALMTAYDFLKQTVNLISEKD